MSKRSSYGYAPLCGYTQLLWFFSATQAYLALWLYPAAQALPANSAAVSILMAMLSYCGYTQLLLLSSATLAILSY